MITAFEKKAMEDAIAILEKAQAEIETEWNNRKSYMCGNDAIWAHVHGSAVVMHAISDLAFRIAYPEYRVGEPLAI